ncbi:hypothetical protein Agub_g1878 [Astrephomene gubernaculifera]|uniref:Formate/nitrite transporter n=1 Tax=Astrephomene gubernaculifera TaxID=47775 RepID=A0AAD3HHU6_9CHLO|nr:hypothetical protein Agub_g1878 [Astrephomene gubernaculifera]
MAAPMLAPLRQRSSKLACLLSSKRFFSAQPQNDQFLAGKALSGREEEQESQSPAQTRATIEQTLQSRTFAPFGLTSAAKPSTSPFDMQTRQFSAPVPAAAKEAAPPAPVNTKVEIVSAPPATLNPAQVYDAIVNIGAYKVDAPAWKTFILGCAAGFYVSFGGTFACQVAGQIPAIAAANPGVQKLMFAGVFPLGLLLVMMCGSELFTGNTAYMTAAIYEGKAKINHLIKNWTLSYAGNLAGSLFVVALLSASGVLAYNAMPATLATFKCGLPLMEAFTRGIICNWMVCAAVWVAMCSNTLAGRIMGMWPPIMGFILMGGEHSVANMFFIPMGMALGAPITWDQFVFNNLLPVTAGNIVGGAFFMATTYSMAFGGLGKKFQKKIDAVTKAAAAQQIEKK